jgi:hypothetical protein
MISGFSNYAINNKEVYKNTYITENSSAHISSKLYEKVLKKSETCRGLVDKGQRAFIYSTTGY